MIFSRPWVSLSSNITFSEKPHRVFEGLIIPPFTWIWTKWDF